MPNVISPSPTAAGRWHVMDWEMSAHRLAQIGCERCHGGNPTAAAVFPAHLGILGRRNAANRLSRRNIPGTGHHVEWLPVEPTDSRHG